MLRGPQPGRTRAPRGDSAPAARETTSICPPRIAHPRHQREGDDRGHGRLDHLRVLRLGRLQLDVLLRAGAAVAGREIAARRREAVAAPAAAPALMVRATA
jgi:hypothetical protein